LKTFTDFDFNELNGVGGGHPPTLLFRCSKRAFISSSQSVVLPQMDVDMVAVVFLASSLSVSSKFSVARRSDLDDEESSSSNKRVRSDEAVRTCWWTVLAVVWVIEVETTAIDEQTDDNDESLVISTSNLTGDGAFTSKLFGTVE
jgi:hypothetical protein